MTTEAVLVLTTCGDAAEGERIAERLVGSRLAACVNRIDGVVSTYRWEGAIERGRECLLVIKTIASRLPEVERAIKESSSYELPEVLAIPAHGGSAEYLGWIAASVEAS